jgi:CIC family chloride channel protein
VMRTNVVAVPGNATLDEARDLVHHNRRPQGQYLFPVVNEQKELLGVVTRKELFRWFEAANENRAVKQIADIVSAEPVVAFADEPLRVVVHRMAEFGVTRMPVLDTDGTRRLAGMISLNDLLLARSQNLAEERARERVLRIRIPFGRERVAEKVIGPGQAIAGSDLTTRTGPPSGSRQE